MVRKSASYNDWNLPPDLDSISVSTQDIHANTFLYFCKVLNVCTGVAGAGSSVVHSVIFYFYLNSKVVGWGRFIPLFLLHAYYGIFGLIIVLQECEWDWFFKRVVRQHMLSILLIINFSLFTSLCWSHGSAGAYFYCFVLVYCWSRRTMFFWMVMNHTFLLRRRHVKVLWRGCFSVQVKFYIQTVFRRFIISSICRNFVFSNGEFVLWSSKISTIIGGAFVAAVCSNYLVLLLQLVDTLRSRFVRHTIVICHLADFVGSLVIPMCDMLDSTLHSSNILGLIFF